MPAQLGGRQLPKVDPIEPDGPFVHVVKPADQVHQRGFATARATHNADPLTRFNLKAHLLQHRSVPLVAKRDVVKSDLAPDRVGPAFPLGLPGFHRGVEQFEHPVAACQKAGEPGRELRQGGEGGVEHRQVGKKRHE